MGKKTDFANTGWYGQHWAAWLKYVCIYHRPSSAQLFFFVSEANPLKVCFHLAWWGLPLANWFCGLKATRLLGILQPNHPDWNPLHLCPHIVFVLVQKTLRGETWKASFEGEVRKTPWRKNRAFPSSSTPFYPACKLLTKAADRWLGINSMEPADESKEEKVQGKTEKLYEDFTGWREWK